ncbi:O-antigen ligase family protein [Cohnella cellulosilytica]|uniref:O-antigen ligase family protein n=1 Tax=Cohnella cellulosilytica TaxID=986710 RepID=A0ABW2FAD7_9BACL
MKKSNRTKAMPTTKRSKMGFGVLLFVVLFLLVAPYDKALFNGYIYSFEKPILLTVLVSSLVLFLIGLHLYRSFRLESHRDLLSILVWLIPLSYSFTLLNAVSLHLALIDFYIRVIWVVFFLIGAYFVQSDQAQRIMKYALAGSGYLIAIYGLLQWFGNVTYQDAILQGKRLSNVFQYPNAYAAYLLAILIITIVILNTTKNKFMYYTASFFLIPLVASILLTLSRGALLVLPIALIFYLIFIPRIKQLITLFYLLISGIISLFLFKPLNNIRENLNNEFLISVSLKGWAMIVISSFIVMMINYLIDRHLYKKYDKFEQNKNYSFSNLLIPILTVTIFIILYILVLSGTFLIKIFPNGLIERLIGFNLYDSSVFSRSTFYNDAFRIVGDYPVFGAGGGAWSVLYDSYRSYPYTSSQVHNFFLQYLMESGFVGLLILVAILVYSFVAFYNKMKGLQKKGKWKEEYLIFPLVVFIILCHSFIDFDMSFVYLAAIVFLCLGIASGSKQTGIKVFQRVTEKLHLQKWMKVYSFIPISTAIVLVVFSSIYLKADANFKKSIVIANKTGSYNELISHLDNAIDLVPSHMDYTNVKVSMLQQLFQQSGNEAYLNEAWKLVSKSESYNEHNFAFIETKINLLMKKGKHEEAASYTEAKLKERPWNTRLYEKAIEIYYELGERERLQGNNELIDDQWNKATSLYMEMEDTIKGFSNLQLNQKNESINNFRISPGIILNIGKIEYRKENYSDATRILARGVSFDLDIPLNREIARWYLAASRKVNLNYTELYNRLVEFEPEEENKIKLLMENKM